MTQVERTIMNTNQLVKGAAAPAVAPPVDSPTTAFRSPNPPPSAGGDGGAPLPVDIGRRGRGRDRPLFDGAIVRRAFVDSFRKLDPRHQVRNPVMFVVEVGSLLTTCLFVQALVGKGEAPAGFILAVSAWLWFTVLFANFAEAMAEGRGKAQADSLRKARKDVHAKRITEVRHDAPSTPTLASDLRKGDLVLVEAGDQVPCDGEIVEGVASVDESAITGESAPVIRESGGDRSAVTGGTRVLSDWLVVRATANPGETFLDRMIAMVEGAKRQKTPNEIALDILIAGMTLILLVAVVTLQPMAIYDKAIQSTAVLVALLDAPARQDRHDHQREPDGDRVPPGDRRDRGRPGRGGTAVQHARRDTGGPVHR
jgi:high-affinity K+ transport system ATPase subunit B